MDSVGMTDAIDLTTEERTTLNELLRRFLPGVDVWAYGSRVKWTARPNSDLDLVAFASPAQQPQVADLKEALAESNLPFPVDLHVWDEVPERFRDIIRKEYVVVQEAKEADGKKGLAGDSPIEYDLRWPVVALSEIAVKIGSGATPKGGADAYLPSRARFALVRSQNVFDRRFDHNGLAFISDEQADGLRGVILQPNDILLNITGDGITFGRACIVPKDVLPACVNQHVSIIRLDPQRADAGYVLAFLTHPDVKSYIESFNAGGSRRAVTKGHIESFRLPLPPLPEQHAIAHILSTLDDKIELNRRMNETLEAMARALFKSWFVDFDPVRAKAEGRNIGLPKPIADLFPDSFEDSELGEIPKGWETGSLDSVLVLQRGFDLPATQRTPGTYPVFAASGPSGTHNEYMVRGPGVTTGRSGVLGKVFYVDDDFWPLNTSLWVKEFRHSRPAYAFHLLLRIDFALFNAGSAVPTLNRNHVHHLPTLLPPMALIDVFERIANGSLQRQKYSSQQSKTLVSLRDTLLPKLISGEFRVKDAERTVRYPTT